MGKRTVDIELPRYRQPVSSPVSQDNFQGDMMSAKIIQFRDYQNPKDLARMYSELTLEQQASVLKIMLLEAIAKDTAPSEMPPDQSA